MGIVSISLMLVFQFLFYSDSVLGVTLDYWLTDPFAHRVVFVMAWLMRFFCSLSMPKQLDNGMTKSWLLTPVRSPAYLEQI